MGESVGTAVINLTMPTTGIQVIARTIAHHLTEMADDLAALNDPTPDRENRLAGLYGDGLAIIAAPGCLNYSIGSRGLASDCWEAGRNMTNSGAAPCAPCIAAKVLAHEELPT